MEDRCVCCGAVIPEGRQVCLICDKKIYGNGTGGQKMANEKRLIDYQKAKEIVLDILRGKITTVTAVQLVTYMKDATVDAVEVVHGRWFMRGGIFRCSECDSKALLKLDSNVGGCREYTHFRSNYCPNCGAKMDGDGNG